MKFRETELLFLYLLFDLTILNVAILLTNFLGIHLNFTVPGDMKIFILHGNLSWLITYFVFSKKNLYLRDGFKNRLFRIFKRTIIFILVSGVVGFLVMGTSLSRLFILQYTTLFIFGKTIFYWFLYRYLKTQRTLGFHVKRIIIVGLNDTGRLLRTIVESNPMMGYHFKGFVTRQSDNDLDIIGHPNDLEQIIKDNKIEMVFVTLSLFSKSGRGLEYLKICNSLGVRLRFVPENQSWFQAKLNMESVGNLMVVNPQCIPMDKIESRLMKRLFDIVFSLMVIVFIFSWLFPIIAIIIKRSSKGPVFFVQERTGINNITFKCLKFRSMKVNNDAHTRQATANDDRLTKIGKLMRRTNVDELPQFFNVLFGQMSVVGPRPHMVKHTQEYSKLIEHYMVRHYVKPGITGWAQINGYRGETDQLWKMEKRVEYDMSYIENWNLWWDVKIVYLTSFGKKTYTNAG